MQHRIRSAGILLKNDCILLIKVRDFSGEYWIPPGGGLEREDVSTKSCLVREFKEETDLDVEVGELICVREFLETHKQRYNVELFYLITAFEGAPSTAEFTVNAVVQETTRNIRAPIIKITE